MRALGYHRLKDKNALGTVPLAISNFAIQRPQRR